MRLVVLVAMASVVSGSAACDSAGGTENRPDAGGEAGAGAVAGAASGGGGNNQAGGGGGVSAAGGVSAGAGGNAGAATVTDGGTDARGPAPDTNPAGADPCATGAAFFCDDFEKATVGNQAPAPWSGNNAIKVTSARAYSGTKAIDIPGGAILNFNLNPARDLLFIRMMVWSAFRSGGVDSRFGIASAKSGSYSAGTDAHTNLVAFYHYPNGESAISSTTVMPLMQWVCLEISYDRTTREFRSWLNGQPVPEFNRAVSGPAIPGGWTSVQVENVIYHGGSGNEFVDDVAFGTARLGCP